MMVGKRDYLGTDDLPGFMTLAGNAEHVARPEHRDRLCNRAAAVADLDGLRRALDDGAADLGWILRARIVVGDEDDVGVLRRRPPHERSLARIAIAAGTEDHDE